MLEWRNWTKTIIHHLSPRASTAETLGWLLCYVNPSTVISFQRLVSCQAGNDGSGSDLQWKRVQIKIRTVCILGLGDGLHTTSLVRGSKQRLEKGTQCLRAWHSASEGGDLGGFDHGDPWAWRYFIQTVEVYDIWWNLKINDLFYMSKKNQTLRSTTALPIDQSASRVIWWEQLQFFKGQNKTLTLTIRNDIM